MSSVVMLLLALNCVICGVLGSHLKRSLVEVHAVAMVLGTLLALTGLDHACAVVVMVLLSWGSTLGVVALAYCLRAGGPVGPSIAVRAFRAVYVVSVGVLLCTAIILRCLQ